MSTTPYQFIKRGNLFITPVGPSIADVPYPTQTFTKPREFSLWVNGGVVEPAFQLDAVRMPPSMYQEVRNDLVRYSPVEVTRSAFQRSNHAYVGVIDSKGKPYYFALDSRGMSVREVPIDDDKVWKNFDRLADAEREMATSKRRNAASIEVAQLNRELSQPQLVILKSDFDWKRKTKERVGRKPKLVIEKAGHTGTMVALHIPYDVAKEIAIPGGESPESMHITVAYLGKDLTDEQKSGALVACRRIAQKCGPIKALLGGVGRFSASHTSEGKDVVYLSVDSPDLTRMRPMLLDELAIEGVAPNNTHGYVPHVTLAYVDTTASTPLKRFPPMPVEFSCLSLTVAEDNMTLPFTTPLVIKALPKKPKEQKAKETPNKTASKKQMGAGGKTRYTYPNEKKGGAGKPGKPGQQPLLVVRHDDSKHANPAELANQLGISVRTLERCAKQLGREGFAKLMRTSLQRFSAKHRIDPDYWGTLYEKLMPGVV